MLILLLPSAVSAFFFPQAGGGGCSCSCVPAAPCPALPTCAIPAPCPEYTTSNWVPAVPGIPAQPVPTFTSVDTIPATSYVASSQPVVTYAESSGCGGATAAIPAFPAIGCSGVPAPALPAAVPSLSAPVPAPPSPVYVPAPAPNFVLQQNSYETPISAIAPQSSLGSIDEIQEDGYRIVEVVAQPTYAPTLIPPVEQPSSSYDDTAPALPPPAPAAPIPEYKTTETVLPTSEYSSGYVPRAEPQYDQESGLHSGETSSFPPLGRKVSTEGVMEPFSTYQRRNLILKRMRNVRTMGAVIPHTNATCNSHKLANIMARAIVPDVSVAKRMVMRSAELAFDGAKFDVFCATGEFSYSIHSRKYCEVTRDDVTCFAFR